MKHPTHDFQYLARCTPTYLFRVHSASSKGSNFSSGFQAASSPPPSLPPFSQYRNLISTHLLWDHSPSSWISTTSSLLWALAYARFKTLSGELDVQISLLASGAIDPETLFPSVYLVSVYEPPVSGKPWHDCPQGEFLAWGQIPGSAVRGTVAWKDLVRSTDHLLPRQTPDEDSRPHQWVNAWRKIKFPSREVGTDHGVPITDQDYVSALKMADLFCDKAARFSLLAMGLAFRARNLDSLEVLAPSLRRYFRGMSIPAVSTIFPSLYVIGFENIPELHECVRVEERLMLCLNENSKL